MHLLSFSILLCVIPMYVSCLPILQSTAIQPNGGLRPKALFGRRSFSIITIHNDGAAATSPTGSSSSSVGLFSSSSSSESASKDSTSSSSSACVFLGGCTSSAATACPLSLDRTDISNSSTSSSLCGSGSSTDSGPFFRIDSPLISFGGWKTGMSELRKQFRKT